LKNLSLLFAILAVVTGLVAAWYWYKSTTAEIDPAIVKLDDGRDAFRLSTWIESITGTVKTASDFNRKAAIWTAVSVLSGALATLSGAWTSN
jgi:hypothetical protein